MGFFNGTSKTADGIQTVNNSRSRDNNNKSKNNNQY